MLIGSEKKKKKGGYALAIGALAMYGAYRMISGIKNACSCGMDSLMKGMKRMKGKTPAAECDTPDECDSDSEPYDG